MATAIEKLDVEHDLVQLLVTEAVIVGMESPLRDPILEAVEETTGESLEAIEETTNEGGTSGTKEKSRLTKVVQGGTVFVVMFAVLYLTLRRLTSDEPNT
ncbi:hypothetical protein OB955_20425 [Halobacteria archaeon AArc-m2/3/4]|uniref:Uncharacterized protein n=1 Tax=Natronoglomus mannanivorans TaxID=2979990 RepID=A0AAP2Z4W2_9EURY|nr:hypothetical protein [Halobacteria archaeon AArc-xg1-1]MCU4975070.1 hypothetical protein [Halobacteria archaeon AArc-m2/3/4]